MTQHFQRTLLLAVYRLVAACGTSVPQAAGDGAADDASLGDAGNDGEQGDGAQVDGDAMAKSDMGTHDSDDSGTPGSDAGDAGDEALMQQLFEDAPDCTGKFQSRFTGDVEGKQVSREEAIVSSNLNAGSFFTTNHGPEQGLYNVLSFRWAREEPTGTLHHLVGKHILADETAFPKGTYCVVGGYLVAAPAHLQDGVRALFYYRVTRVRERAGWGSQDDACSGPELEANIVGCFQRARPELP